MNKKGVWYHPEYDELCLITDEFAQIDGVIEFGGDLHNKITIDVWTGLERNGWVWIGEFMETL